jgi:hypothetical protein
VLIGSADVSGHDLQDYSVIDLLPGWVFQLRIIDGLNFNMIWTEKDDSAIGRHKISLSVVKTR